MHLWFRAVVYLSLFLYIWQDRRIPMATYWKRAGWSRWLALYSLHLCLPCQTVDVTGVTRCPSWIRAQSQVFPLLLHPQSLSVPFFFHFIFFLLTFSYNFFLPVLYLPTSLITSSQRSVGYICGPGDGKSTAAKEKADISVSLKGLSRWLL